MHILQHKQSANAEDFTEVLIEFLGMEFLIWPCGEGVFQFFWMHFVGQLEYQINLL